MSRRGERPDWLISDTAEQKTDTTLWRYIHVHFGHVYMYMYMYMSVHVFVRVAIDLKLVGVFNLRCIYTCNLSECC